MSIERKLARQTIKAKRGNKKVSFNTLWMRYQIEKYGSKKAKALNVVGKGIATLTRRIKMAANS